MHRTVRNLSSIVFVAAIAIACSKKEEPANGAPPAEASASAALAPAPPTVVTEPPAPVVDVPPAPSSSVATAPSFAPPPTKAPREDKRKHAKADQGEKNDDLQKDALKTLEDGDLDPSKPATKPAKPKPAATASASTSTGTANVDEKPKDRESQPSATPLKRRVTVTTASHYACSTKDHKESVSVASETRGARITIGGQGPCPGEIKEWVAEVGDKRVDVHGTHGAQSRCTCAGTGDMVLRGLDPGTYDVHVNGGFNRPIAVRVVVGSP